MTGYFLALDISIQINNIDVRKKKNGFMGADRIRHEGIDRPNALANTHRWQILCADIGRGVRGEEQ